MKKKAEKRAGGGEQSSKPEQVSPEDALKRMRSFSGRKEKFIAAIKKSKD